MTDYELRKLAKLQAQYLAEAMKQDDELLDLVFPPKVMGVKEAAEFLGLSINAFYKKVQEIPHTKQGKHLFFTDRGLIRWINRKSSVAVELGIKKVI